MKEFYKKYSLLTKMILLILILIVHIIMINSIRDEAKKSQATIELIRVHSGAEDIIAEKLKNSCSRSGIEALNLEVGDFLKTKSVGFDLALKEVIQIKDLIFSELILRTFVDKAPFPLFQSEAYVVSHKESGNCFGII